MKQEQPHSCELHLSVGVVLVVLHNIQEICVRDSQVYLTDLFLGFEIAECLGYGPVAFAEPELVDYVTHIDCLVSLSYAIQVNVTIASIIEEFGDDIPIPMARKMEIPRHPVNKKPTLHSTSLPRFEILTHSFFLQLSIIGLLEWLHPRQVKFLDSIPNINFMNFQYILNIETQHGARIPRKTDIHINLQLLLQMFMINNQIRSISWSRIFQKIRIPTRTIEIQAPEQVPQLSSLGTAWQKSMDFRPLRIRENIFVMGYFQVDINMDIYGILEKMEGQTIFQQSNIIQQKIQNMSQNSGTSEQDNCSDQLPPPSNSQSPSNGLATISPYTQIFIDTDTPYTNAPPTVKEILNKAKDNLGSLNPNRIDLGVLAFEPRPTDNHRCMHLFERNIEGYYHCSQCTGERWETHRVIFCDACFKQEDHQGHHYYFEKCTSRECYCDCGSAEKTNKDNYRCARHGEDRKIEIDINDQNGKLFLEVCISLFEVAFYVNSNDKIVSEVCQMIDKLCKNSAYYTKLAVKILKSRSKYNTQVDQNDQPKCFFALLCQIYDISSIIMCICANSDQQMELVSFLVVKFLQITNPEGNGYDSVNVSDFIRENLFGVNYMWELAKQGKFAINRFAIYEKIVEEKQGSPQYRVQTFILFMKKMLTLKNLPQNYLQQNMTSLKPIVCPQIAWLYLRLFVQKYSKPDIKRVNALKKNKKDRKKQAQERQELQYRNKFMHETIMYSIMVISKGSYKIIENIRSGFKENSVDGQKFQAILQEIAYYIKDFFFQKEENTGNQIPLSMITFTLLIKNSPKCDQLVNLFWLSLLAETKTMQQTAANFYEIASAIAWSEAHLTMLEGVIQSFPKDPLVKSQSIQIETGREIKMSDFFKRYLANRQMIPRQDLIDMKKDRLLQFEDLGKIIRTTCTYNSEDEAFFYNSSYPEPTFRDKFVFFLNEADVASTSAAMYSNTNIFYGFGENVQIQDYQKELYTTMLNSSVLLELMEQGWQQASKKRYADPKEGYLYLFCLVFVHGFSKGKQKTNLAKKLQKIANQFLKNNMTQFSQSQSEKLMINLLLRIQPEEQKLKLPNQKQNTLVQAQKKQEISKPTAAQLDKLEKFESKLKKLQQKYKQKRTLALQMVSKSIDCTLSDQEICMTCRQKSRPDNQLVYLGRVSVGGGLCNAMHGDNDKANVNMFTCFHILHVNCFITSHQGNRNSSFSCPLCATTINCFFLRNYDLAKPNTKLIFTNIIIATLLINYKIYNTEHPFMLYFKHFVQAKGLRSLASSTENWQRCKITDKSDHYLEKVMIQTFDGVDERLREIFLQDIQKFLKDINTCTNQAAKLVQLAIAEIYRQKLIKGQNLEINTQNLINLRSLIKTDEFEIIKEQLQAITSQKIELPPQQPPKSDSQKQSLTFTLHQLPRDSTQFAFFLANNPCLSNHNRRPDYFCLICGRGICDECNETQNHLSHGGVEAYLSVDDFVVHFINASVELEIEVYFNDFRMTYQDRDQSFGGKDVYVLDVLELGAATEKFMQQ